MNPYGESNPCWCVFVFNKFCFEWLNSTSSSNKINYKYVVSMTLTMEQYFWLHGFHFQFSKFTHSTTTIQGLQFFCLFLKTHMLHRMWLGRKWPFDSKIYYFRHFVDVIASVQPYWHFFLGASFSSIGPSCYGSMHAF